MAGYRYPGPVCTENDSPWWVDSGTMCRQNSPPPGVVPSKAHREHARKKDPKHKKKKVAVPKPIPTTREGFLKEIRANEGEFTYMYLDTKGFATVGIGLLIEDTKTHKITDEAKNWPFVVRASALPATPEQVEADFTEVKKRPWGKKIAARSFQPYTKLDLTTAKVNELFEQKVKGFWASLQAEFGSDFDKYPMPVQYALLDMIFNLGRGGEHVQGKGKHKKIVKTGLHKYGRLREALDHKDWKKAGDVSHRSGPGQARNDRIKSWFYSAESPVATPVP